MAEERGVLRRIVWHDVLPGLMLFRCFRIATGLTPLFLATAGAVLMPIGPWLAETTMPREVVPGNATIAAVTERASRAAATQPPQATMPRVWDGRFPDEFLQPRFSVPAAYVELSRPVFNIFDRHISWGQLSRHSGIALWYLLVWSLLGGAITRIAVVRLGRGEPVPWKQSLQHARANFGWYFAAPLFPLAGVGFTALFVAVLGVVMRLDAGVLLAGLVWPLALLAGILMAVLLTGLLFGWPLMWPTISAEASSDAFQAFSNSFSFTFQRPLSYLAYAVVAVILGGIGGIFVETFAEAIIGLVNWGLSFGSGRERLQAILSGRDEGSWLFGGGIYLMNLGNWVVRRVATGYYFSYLFCAASAIYLLLRREVDQTEFEEVYLPDGAEPFALPALQPGPHGVPEMTSPESPSEPDKPSA